MKKIFALTIAFIAGIALTANAGSIAPGQMAKCNDAKSITLSTAGSANTTSGKWGFTSVMIVVVRTFLFGNLQTSQRSL